MNADAAHPYEDLDGQEQVEAIMDPHAGPAVLDFWSPTCGPCMAMADDFSHVAAQFEPEELRFYKINIATHGHLAAPFNVRSVPTILFVNKGQILDAIVGKIDAKRLGERSEWLVKKASKRGLLGRLLG